MMNIGKASNSKSEEAVETGKSKAKKVKTCLSCPSGFPPQPVSQFYASYSSMHQDGLIPFCKKCVQKLAYNFDTDDIDVDKLKGLLRQIDKPFVSSILQSSIDQYNRTYGGKNCPKNNRLKIIGYYFKNIHTLRQYVTMNWQEGLLWEEKVKTKTSGGISSQPEKGYELKTIQNDDPDNEVYSLSEDREFVVTEDIVRLFGNGYKKHEYVAMWKKYQFLKTSYPDVTNLHVEALVTYVRFKVKEELATADGNVSEAEKWNAAAVKAAEKAKINPSQLSQSDLQGGLNSFSELLQAVEQAVDVIPILPQFKYSPKDAIDFNIYCIINYLRDLEGKPLCSYSDIYKFYDERKKEYVEQNGDPYGIFTDDTTEGNRASIERFITLPADYNDSEDTDAEPEDE